MITYHKGKQIAQEKQAHNTKIAQNKRRHPDFHSRRCLPAYFMETYYFFCSASICSFSAAKALMSPNVVEAAWF